jgi:predicted  nucleic acid-binding Zn-ribbon protein
MNDVIGSVRQTLQDFLAPELRQHRAELVSIRGELSAKIEAVESKIGAVETRLDSKIDAVDSRLESKIDGVESRLESKIEVLKSEVRSGFSALGAQLENAVLRGELSTTREIADLRIRVERLEKERGQLPQ